MGQSFSLNTLKFLLNSLSFFPKDVEPLKIIVFVQCRKIWKKIGKKSFISWFIPINKPRIVF